MRPLDKAPQRSFVVPSSTSTARPNHTLTAKHGLQSISKRASQFPLKGATSQVAGSPAVLDRTVIVLNRTIIVLDRIVIVLDRTVTAIYSILSLNFLRPGGGSDHLWLLRAARHTRAPALPTLSILSGDRYVNKTLPSAGLFPGARSCAFNTFFLLARVYNLLKFQINK